MAGRVNGSMHFRTEGDGKVTELSQYEKDTMVLLCYGHGEVILSLESFFSVINISLCHWLKRGSGFLGEERPLVMSLFR